MNKKVEEARCCLMSCDCSAYQYAHHALQLLQIDFSISSADDDHFNGIIVICHHHAKDKIIRKQLTNVLDFKKSFLLVTAGETENFQSEFPLIQLEIPFSIIQIKDALLQLKNANEKFLPLDDHPVFDDLIGDSLPIIKIKKIIKQVAESDSNVLILGQSGTGKEIIASIIHRLSHRHGNPFIPINCGAIPSELIESELFGHEKGAFTGASSRRSGRFELANTGTLFLDEIGDMPLQMQVKLLRVIQDKLIERIGASKSINIDVRLIAATNRDLETMVASHTFREDLYYRLNVIPIYVPTLHERASDIPLLINNQLKKISGRIPHQTFFSDEAIDSLCKYEWPGNIRELGNFVERMVVLYQDKVIEKQDVHEQLNRIKVKQHVFTFTENTSQINLKTCLSDIEQKLINMALEKSNGIIGTAAEYLNLGKAALLEKMKEYKFAAIE